MGINAVDRNPPLLISLGVQTPQHGDADSAYIPHRTSLCPMDDFALSKPQSRKDYLFGVQQAGPPERRVFASLGFALIIP